MIVLDTETTGLSPEKNSIISIGALDFYNPETKFYIECNTWKGAEINEIALKINGFTEEQIRTNPISLEEATEKFLNWITKIPQERWILAGENIRWDWNFLENSAQRYGKKWPMPHRTYDLHTKCLDRHEELGIKIPIKNGLPSLSLDETLKFVGLPEEPKPHNAFTGAKVEAEAISRLKYGLPLFEEFGKYKVPSYLRR